MNILQTLQQLRDDLKSWVTNNLNALNAKIDEKTIPIDNELDSNSTNPVQNKAITNAINNIPKFSGDYNDLTNAPNIDEDDSGNVVIADESGNIIFKADADGIHTTTVTVNDGTVATERYVDDAIAEIPTPDVSGQIEAHNISEIAHEDIRQAINTAKEELSESIVAESEEWKIVDEAGNIIFSVDASGAHTTELTLNGESVATEFYVDEVIANIEIPEVDFTGYATEIYVDNKVADLVNSAPEALDTLGELATALENHEDAYDALLETVGSKATPEDLENMKAELSESIVSEQQEFHVVDDEGNIVTSIDSNGVTTTIVTAQNIIVNGDSVEEHINDIDIHITASDKNSWNNKVDKIDGKGLSTNDFTDVYKTRLDNLEGIVGGIVEETDPTVPAWAKEATKPTYTAEEVGLGNVDNTSDTDKPVSTATQNAIDDLRTELSETIVSESDTWHIVDDNGNVIFSVDATGATTTSLIVTEGIEGYATEIYVDEKVAEMIDDLELITVSDIDAICNNTPLIQNAEEVSF